MKVEVEAIRAMNDFLEAAPEITPQAASLAMNTVIPRKGLSRYKKAIRSQVAFPGGYLEEAEKFGITQYAKPGDLTAAITARQRPTSLARFASGPVGGEGATVRVKTGRSVRLKRAFMVRLLAGTQLTGDDYNLGLAIRVPGGQAAVRGKTDTSRMVHLAKDVFLLYGPSVDQVFRSVSVTETPHVLNEIETEFYRQFARLS
jgi:hypothetical protein